jgi:hypothetical protein
VPSTQREEQLATKVVACLDLQHRVAGSTAVRRTSARRSGRLPEGSVDRESRSCSKENGKQTLVEGRGRRRGFTWRNVSVVRWKITSEDRRGPAAPREEREQAESKAAVEADREAWHAKHGWPT